MDTQQKQALAASLRDFHMPRYADLPDDGLYLKQAETYINRVLAPLGLMEITTSMIRNYVKQDIVENPVQKLYRRDQIGYLICITVLKHAAPLDCIQQMFAWQRSIYTSEMAYNYFCEELENVLFYLFGLKEHAENVGVTASVEKDMFRSAITAVCNMVYLNACYQLVEK